ncbi:MAG: PAS domain-containing protein [Bacillota bacterium]
MNLGEWIKEFPGAITVCGSDGIIIEMNDRACKMFEKDGGSELIGKNVLDCHPGKAREKIKEMLESRAMNCYTIEKNGVKKLVYQTPWYKDGQYMGLAELVLEIPFDMPHFLRK